MSQQQPSLKIALTFDDLPAHGPLPSNTTRAEIAKKLVEAFRQENVPPVYGFVNGALIEQQPADTEVLKIWRDAGHLLGNHTWSHPHLNVMKVEDYEKEITRNEAVISGPMGKEDWHWFRYPFLDEGDTAEKRTRIRAFLGGRGYRMAGVTMSFGDYMWTDVYTRCVAKNDQAAIATLRSSFLAAAEDGIRRYREMSQKALGRDVPYVLLMHIGPLGAEMMPELLKLYRSRGFTFVTLAEAESDEFYRPQTELSGALGPTSFEEMLEKKGLPVPQPAVTLPAFDGMCK